MDFENIFKQAAVIAWKYKILWLFGILTGCGTSNVSSNYRFNQSFGGFDPNSGALDPKTQRFFLEADRFFNEYADAMLGWAIALMCFSLILQLIFFVVRNYGFAGLTAATANIEKNGLESVNFGTVSQLGSPYVLRLIGVNLILAIPGVLLFVLMIFGFMGLGIGTDNTNYESMIGTFFMLFCCLCCVWLIVSLVIGVYGRLVKTSLVVDDLGVFESFGRAWTVLTENFGSYVALILMMFVLSIGIGIVMAIPGVIIAIPASQIFSFQDPSLFFENIQQNFLSLFGLSL